MTMIYEMRRYECAPGKLPALHNMMENMALPAFKRCEMHFVGAWSITVGDQEGTLIYLLGFDSMDDRVQKWERFHKDKAWLEGRATVREKEGVVVARQVSTFLAAAPYSPLK
jgi:hypothetical protein